MKKYLLLCISLSFFFTNCSSDDTITIPDDSKNQEEETAAPVVKKRVDYPVQDFMWQAMNFWYLWQDDVADLDDTKLTSGNYTEFLASETDPDVFFHKLCYNHKKVVGENAAVDRFSSLFENFEDFIDEVDGLGKRVGVEFGISRINNESKNVLGYVRYIVPESNAEQQDIKRGDLFVGVNGTTLTIDNYTELLFGDRDSFTLNFAEIENNQVVANGKELSLTKQEGLIENPILINKVIERNGIKIGYLMYNSFVQVFEEELNNAFGKLKSEGIQELILDFRYNGGGAASTALQIGSSVYGTKTDEVFFEAIYNSKIEANFRGTGPTKFTDTTLTGSPINSLNLNKVHVIATKSTASASELVMHGLAPYIDVVHIGEKTVGKSESSILLVDDDSSGPTIFTEDIRFLINRRNKWVISPIIGKTKNADGFSVSKNGLEPKPELKLAEDMANLGVLGDPSEPLLALTINKIIGSSSKVNFEPVFPVDLISSSATRKVTNNELIMNDLIEPGEINFK